MDEIVDIVNEQDEVIGQMGKQEAHRIGALHRTVIAELENSRGNLILVRQSASRQDAGKLVNPVGGHVKAGENLEEALKREVAEETGITDFKFKFIGKAIFYRQVLGRAENHYFIVYKIFSDQKPVPNYEGLGFEEFEKEELEKQVKQNPEKFGEAFHFVMKEFWEEIK